MKESPHPVERTTSSPSRRAVLKGGVAGAVAAGVAPRAFAAPSKELHKEQIFLLDRTTWGLHAQEIDDIRALGYDDWLESQLDWESIDDSAADLAVQGQVPILSMTPWQIHQTYKDYPYVPLRMSQLLYPLRGWLSRRQLYYRMCEFWTNYFNTHVLMMDQEWLWVPYNQMLVPHAMGNFHDLLQASAEGGSMMFYLNQEQSDKDFPIENYARELLELHTLGLSADPQKPTYFERDVVESARILTGWGFKPPVDGQYGDFEFTAAKHDYNPKKVLGVHYPSTSGPGKPEGDDLIAQLAADPKTSVHVANRLIGHFVMDDPPAAYRDSVAQAFASSGGDIKATVRAMFRRGIYKLPNRKKVRRPLYLLTAFLRATQPTLLGPGIEVHAAKMGHSPGHRASPDGYPTENEEWYEGLLPRLVFLYVAAHDGAGLTLSDARLAQLFPGSPATYAKQANRLLAGGVLPAGEVSRIQQALDALPAQADARREALTLLFSGPSYQYLLA